MNINYIRVASLKTGAKHCTQRYDGEVYNRKNIRKPGKNSDWSLVEHTQCYVSAVDNCKSICMRIRTVEWNTLNAATGKSTTARTSSCANVSSIYSRAEKICGWDGGHQGWQLETLSAAQQFRMRIKQATEENLRFLLYVCYMYNYWGDSTDAGLSDMGVRMGCGGGINGLCIPWKLGLRSKNL